MAHHRTWNPVTCYLRGTLRVVPSPMRETMTETCPTGSLLAPLLPSSPPHLPRHVPPGRMQPEPLPHGCQVQAIRDDVENVQVRLRRGREDMRQRGGWVVGMQRGRGKGRARDGKREQSYGNQVVQVQFLHCSSRTASWCTRGQTVHHPGSEQGDQCPQALTLENPR